MCGPARRMVQPAGGARCARLARDPVCRAHNCPTWGAATATSSSAKLPTISCTMCAVLLQMISKFSGILYFYP